MQQHTTTTTKTTTTTTMWRLGRAFAAGLSLGLLAASGACSTALDIDEAGDAAATASLARSKDEQPVIVGAVDWQDVALLPDGTAERENARAVAFLELPAVGSRCTAFLVTPDVVMTNQHCIPDAAAARGARALFRYETGASDVAAFDCSTFLGNDAALDFALLQCTGRPGDTWGVLAVDPAVMQVGASAYVIHQNCDFYADPSCAPTKKLSPGRIRAVSAETEHDADTLGGSSGSPLFSADTHRVIGLHHVGVGSSGAGRGTVNRAVPMARILPVLAQRFPGLTLGGRAASTTPSSTTTTTTTTATTTDGYEPNDTLAGATRLAVPFASTGARIDAGDRDVYAFDGDGAPRTITLTLNHADGDLDLFAYDAAGNLLARSNGVTNTEQVTIAFGGLVRIVVVGYNDATGAYALTLR